MAIDPSAEKTEKHAMGSVADKIAKKIAAQGRSKVIDLAAWREGKEMAREAGLDDDRLAHLLSEGYDPCHALYIFGQNVASILGEQISGIKEAKGFAKIVGNAEDEYMPGGPPMSPLSQAQPRQAQALNRRGRSGAGRGSSDDTGPRPGDHDLGLAGHLAGPGSSATTRHAPTRAAG